MTQILKIKDMDTVKEETFPTKTERIDELFRKVQNLEGRILTLESTIQMMRSNPAEPTVYGPGPGNPPWRQDTHPHDLKEIVTMEKKESNPIQPTVSRFTSSRERMNPYDLGSVHKHRPKRK